MAKPPSFVRWKRSQNPCEPDSQPCSLAGTPAAPAQLKGTFPARRALGSSQTWITRREPSQFPDSCLSSSVCFPCCLGSYMDLLAPHGGTQPAPSPQSCAWGCGVMEERSSGCFREPPGLLQDLRCLVHHHLQHGASHPTYGSWWHRVLQELWAPGMVWDGRDQGCHSLGRVPRKGLPQPEDGSSGPAWRTKALPTEQRCGGARGVGGSLPAPQSRGQGCLGSWPRASISLSDPSNNNRVCQLL